MTFVSLPGQCITPDNAQTGGTVPAPDANYVVFLPPGEGAK
jgi:hypothetical protein